LETITYNPNAAAVIIASGETKSKIVAIRWNRRPSPDYPATCMQKLPLARFYLTKGAASRLKERKTRAQIQAWKTTGQTLEELVINGSLERGVPLQDALHRSSAVPEWKLAERLSRRSALSLINRTRGSLAQKIKRGLHIPENQRILHTGPHHDDMSWRISRSSTTWSAPRAMTIISVTVPADSPP